ncbi:MAG: UspA domain protein [Nocardioidaceae bacterium]|nr:UspA domain protein [Nocardioidaceae bacterium]
MANIILVGVDGSDTARKAAQTAAELALATGATLHVLTAFDKADIERIEIGHDTWVVSSYDEAENVAKDTAQTLKDAGLTIEVSALHGKPAEALVEEAKHLEARLIVVGNRRVQGIGRILGSVAASVAQHAPCDVYIVKTV